MQLVIAEKPSCALAYAKVLGANEKKKGYYQGNNYIVSWCYGHLVGLAEPESYDNRYRQWKNVPVIPSKWLYEVKENTRSQFEIVKNLMNHLTVDSIVNAADAGREGELIFRHVYEMSGCRKPVKRLWLSSLEDTAVKEGFEHLKDGSYYENLYKSALCRERADWIVGMNMTRFFTILYNSTKPLTIGRVQTPTLALIVERDKQISSFTREKYYTVALNCGAFSCESERFTDLSEAERIAKKCNLSHAAVNEVTKKEKHINPPKLYDLTALQREANRLYGYTAQQTLEALQRLYDNKLVTYPRTDSRYLTEDMGDTARNIIDIIKERFDIAKTAANEPNISAVLDSSKVTDHHALIPTVNIKTADFDKIITTDRQILYLIAERLLTATAERCVYEDIKVILDCQGVKFVAKGKTVVNMGFRKIDENFFNTVGKIEKAQTNSGSLSEISEGNSFAITSKLAEHFTSPPKPFTEDTLLAAMENAGNGDYDTDEVERKGLGTPATRAGIIENLINRGYVERKGKNLISTDKGKNLIKIMPERLCSPKMTAEWENRLVLVSKGQADSEIFMKDISDFVKSVIETTYVEDSMKDFFNEREVIGICPRCGNNIYEGKLNFYCGNKDCTFTLWKENKFFSSKKKSITKPVAAALLKNGKVRFKDLYSEKTGKTYEAYIILDDSGGKYVNFKIEFPQKSKR
ncbi:MAG: DNA topoisomerase 3 [Clostridiales bacterium]|nr:DNA topoisomerase 3 [Clostridiales bacterium]